MADLSIVSVEQQEELQPHLQFEQFFELHLQAEFWMGKVIFVFIRNVRGRYRDFIDINQG